MSKVTIKLFRPTYPTPAALITPAAADGNPNVVTLGEVFAISPHTRTTAGVAIVI
jgi:dienelactone hydrolase